MDLTLHRAVSSRDIRQIRTALQKGADPNGRSKSGGTPLHWAAKSEFPEAVDILIKHGSKVDTTDNDNKTALLIASFELYVWEEDQSENKHESDDRSLQVVQALIRHGAAVNTVDDSGRSAIHYAAIRGNALMAKTLIESGADLKVKDKKGRTVMDAWEVARNKMTQEILQAQRPRLQNTTTKKIPDDDSEVDSEDEEVEADPQAELNRYFK